MPPPPAGQGQLSPDGRYRWDGTRWVAVDQQHTTAPLAAPGYPQRQISPDGRFWWDGQRWLPYKRINWNSVQLGTNPPEDAAVLSRNLGIWCVALGAISLFIGCLSILALVSGIVALVHWGGFQRSNARAGGVLPGSDSAVVGLVLAILGLAELLLALALRFVVIH